MANLRVFCIQNTWRERPDSATLSIAMDKVDITHVLEEQIKVFEGDQLHLICISNRSNATMSWVRSNAITVNNTLTINNVRLADTGMYLCKSIISDVVETQNVSVIVLYPPSYPGIEGTTSGLIGEEVTLKCISNANPPPMYQWKRVNQNGVVLSRNQTLQISISEDISRVVCIAQSLMVTTLGNSKRADVARAVTIFSYVGAIIHAIDKGSNLKLIEGEDIDILCDAIGRPVPDVWWTKTGNKSFNSFGKRLIGYDIDTDFAGTYVCHAGNNITSVNKTVIETYTTKLIHVKVAESSVFRLACSSVECAGYYERDLSTDNNTNGKTDFTSDDTINPEKKDKELILIITDVIGWTALAISIIINIWFCKVNKRNTEKLSTIKTQTEESSELSGYSYARSLPESHHLI